MKILKEWAASIFLSGEWGHYSPLFMGMTWKWNTFVESQLQIWNNAVISVRLSSWLLRISLFYFMIVFFIGTIGKWNIGWKGLLKILQIHCYFLNDIMEHGSQYWGAFNN